MDTVALTVKSERMSEKKSSVHLSTRQLTTQKRPRTNEI